MQEDVTAIRAAVEGPPLVRIPGELDLMEQILKKFKVCRINALLLHWKIEHPPGAQKTNKARLLIQKAPLAELQMALGDESFLGEGEHAPGLTDGDEDKVARAERKRLRHLVHTRSLAWTPPTSAAHRQLQRQLAWKARCDEMDAAVDDAAAVA